MTVRRLVGAAILPLAAAMVFLSSTPWMRAFAPSTVVPLLVVAAVVSVAVPALVVRAFDRPAPWSIVASAVLFVLLALFGVLRQPLGFEDLGRGFIHGPARLLSETLPVDHPRFLFVVPVALCWLVGAITGELLARGRSVGWPSLIPLVGFGLAFAATSGGAGNDVGWAVALFAVDGVLLFSRQWLQRGPSAVPADGDPTRNPIRPLVYGIGTLIIAGLVCAFAVPAVPALKGAPTTPTRTPPVTTVEPITPTAEVAELRDTGALRGPATLYTVTVNRPTPGYVSLTDLDAYDGDVWSFNGTFRPTGGSVPVALGMSATSTRDLVTQHYTAVKPPAVPWMPFIDRPGDRGRRRRPVRTEHGDGASDLAAHCREPVHHSIECNRPHPAHPGCPESGQPAHRVTRRARCGGAHGRDQRPVQVRHPAGGHGQPAGLTHVGVLEGGRTGLSQRLSTGCASGPAAHHHRARQLRPNRSPWAGPRSKMWPRRSWPNDRPPRSSSPPCTPSWPAASGYPPVWSPGSRPVTSPPMSRPS